MGATMSGWMLSLTSMSGVVGFGMGQGEFVSVLRIREMMKKMQRSFSH
ncbi:hypothetical protein CFP56_030629 [Quercus suber]|uniref:Uncharacterized protein n=1 Tax=Quercus suber TaxID=58331 RepID=A0AAW0LVB6_QUESU